MTLGPKFYTKLVLAITRRRKRVRRSYRLESSPNCLNIPNLLSKQDFQKSEFSHKRPLREYLMTCFLYILLLIRFHFILFDFILSYLFYYNSLLEIPTKAVSYGLRFFLRYFTLGTPTRKDPSFQNQEKSREPLQNPNQLGQQLEILKSKKIEKS